MSSERDINQLISELFAAVKASGSRRNAGKNWDFLLRHSTVMLSSYLKSAESGLEIVESGLYAIAWLEAFGENFSYEAYECDDEGFEMQSLCSDCAKILRLAVNHREATRKFRTDIADRVMGLARFPVYREGCIDTEELHRNISLSIVPVEERLKSLDGLIAEERKKGTNVYRSSLPDLAIERYRLLLDLGRNDDAERAILEDVVEEKVCEFRASKYLEEGNVTGALGVLSLGIDRLWKCFDGYHKTVLWQKKLEIYERDGDFDGLISCYRALFNLACAPYDLDYYRKLKAMMPVRDWEMLYYQIMAEKRFMPHFMMSTGSEDTKAAILIEENRLDELGDYLANVGPMYILPGCEQYGAKVPKEKVGPLLLNCAAELRLMAQPTTGSSRYNSIAHYMQVLQQLPGGKKTVADLKEEFVRNYSYRPAMMRALMAVKT